MAKQLRKHRTGYLYKRGPDGKQLKKSEWHKPGTWYLQYMVNGKLFRQSLKTSNKEKAKTERERIMARFKVADEVEALETVKQRLESAHRRFDEIDEAENPPLATADAWQAYLKSVTRPQSGERTLSDYEQYFRRFMTWLQTDHKEIMALCQVTPAIAQEYAQTINGERCSANTYNKHISFLRLFFRVMADAARTESNPFEKIARKKQIPNSRRELTVDELQRVLTTAEGELGLLFGIGAFTGMRFGDCCTLKWGEIDLHRALVNRVPNKTARSKGKPVIIGMPDTLRERLAAIPTDERGEYVLPQTAQDYKRGLSRVSNPVQRHFIECGIDIHREGTGQRIKRNKNGQPVRDEQGRLELIDTGKPAVVEVGFHSLRHTYVSLHAERGTPAAVIQDNVGHANPSMTRHYTHVSEIAAKQYAAVLPAALGIGETTHTDPIEALRAIKASVDDLNGKNWRKIKSDAAAVLESAGVR